MISPPNPFISMKQHQALVVLLLLLVQSMYANIPTDSLLAYAKHQIYLQPNKAKEAAEQALIQAKDSGDSLQQAYATKYLAQAAASQHDYKQAVPLFCEAIYQLKALNQPRVLAYTQNNLALIYQELGLFEKATALHISNLRFFEAEQDSFRLGQVYNNLGLLHLELGDKEKALEYYEQTLTHTKQTDSSSLGYVALNKGSIYEAKEQYEQAYGQYHKALQYFKTVKEEEKCIATYLNLAALYLKFSRLDSALHYQKKAYCTQDLCVKKALRYHLQLGVIYYQQKEYTQAQTALDEAYKISQEQKQYGGLAQVLEYLRKTHFALRNYQLAEAYSAEAAEVQATINKEERLKLVQRLEIRYAVEQKEQEIAHLNDRLALEQNKRLVAEQQAELQQTYRNMAIGIVAIGLLLIALLINRMSMRQKLFAAREASLKQQHQISELERQQLEADLAHKERSLSNMALAVVHKNEMLDHLEDQLQHLVQDHQVASVVVKPIQKMIKEQVSIEEDWNQFKVHFEAVHPGFYKKLLQLAPALTQNDLRHCTYMKVKLDSKEIARIMGISPKSVQMSRYRIKKKLNLDKEEDLFGFIEMV